MKNNKTLFKNSTRGMSTTGVILIVLIIAVGAVLLLGSGDDANDDSTNDAMEATANYEVTIENLTESQPFSPGVIATHDESVSVWETGASASEGIRLIAENGMPQTAVANLAAVVGSSSVVATEGPIHRIGGPDPQSRTVTVSANEGADRLSVAVMLICTNDGFTGVSSLELPTDDQPVVAEVDAYDAGTEENDELFSSLVPPCGAAGPVENDSTENNRTATDGSIGEHAGITGDADLSADEHGFDDPVARITVERVQ